MPHVREWSKEQRALMEWLSRLPPFRDPPTLSALARKLEVAREMLYQWQDLPGFEEALAVEAKRTTLKLEPEYLKSLQAAMVKASPNDRLVMVYWRYIRPSLIDEQERGEWDRILPEISQDSYKLQDAQAKVVSEIRSLPTEIREILLNIVEKIGNQGQAEVETLQPFISVRRAYTGEDEEEPAPLPALPAPAAQDATTPRYDPQRGMRKPLRKPKV